MGALNDIDLLASSYSFLLPKIVEAEEEVHRHLEESGSTVFVNSLRAFRLHRVVIVVGMFSIYESALQSEYGWVDPFVKLREELKNRGEEEIAKQFWLYYLAVNALKHGDGPSFRKLASQKDQLDFRIKSDDGWFDEEGDVSEGQYLVDADDIFVERCAELIDATNQLVRQWHC